MVTRAAAIALAAAVGATLPTRVAAQVRQQGTSASSGEVSRSGPVAPATNTLRQVGRTAAAVVWLDTTTTGPDTTDAADSARVLTTVVYQYREARTPEGMPRHDRREVRQVVDCQARTFGFVEERLLLDGHEVRHVRPHESPERAVRRGSAGDAILRTACRVAGVRMRLPVRK